MERESRFHASRWYSRERDSILGRQGHLNLKRRRNEGPEGAVAAVVSVLRDGMRVPLSLALSLSVLSAQEEGSSRGGRERGSYLGTGLG